jgi:hypothetical protein
VLASADDGSAILFHSECSVIANNFILRPEDEAHINEIDPLMGLSPEEVWLCASGAKRVVTLVTNLRRGADLTEGTHVSVLGVPDPRPARGPKSRSAQLSRGDSRAAIL